MSANAKLSKDTKLSIGSGSPVSYTQVKGVASISVPGISKDEIEVTDLSSSSKEYIDGLGDAGELSFELILEPGAAAGEYEPGQEALKEAHETGGLRSFKIELPAAFGISYTFSGFVKSFSERAEQNDAIRADVVIRVSGAVTRS